MKKQIRLKCVDFWEGYNAEEDFLIKLLKEKYDIVWSNSPDYLIVSSNGTKREHLNYDCIKIFFTGESEVPDFNLYDYAIGFDFIDFGDRYFRMPLYFFYTESIEKVQDRKAARILSNKTEFCNYIYSNWGADPFREKLFEALNEYKHVVSGGKCRNNIGGPVENKMELVSKCKFTIACENSEYDGYTTEKILEAFAGNTVPIYWGNPLVEKDFNGKTFINCHKYHSMDEIVEEVKRIDRDDNLYATMMRENVFAEGMPERRNEAFKAFLYHIFDQDYEKAGRRNKSFQGRLYEDRQKSYGKLEELIEQIGHETKIKYFRFRNVENLKGKKIVIFGAGDVGRDYYAQFEKYREIQIIAWIDSNWESIQSDHVQITGIDRLTDLEFDHTVIAVSSERMAGEIKYMLLACGCPAEKIVWEAPETCWHINGKDI